MYWVGSVKLPRLTVCMDTSSNITIEEWVYAIAIHGKGRAILFYPTLIKYHATPDAVSTAVLFPYRTYRSRLWRKSTWTS